MDVVIADAASRRGHPTVGFTVPLSQGDLIRHLLARGMRVEPFYILVLADEPAVDFARYLPTNPSFII